MCDIRSRERPNRSDAVLREPALEHGERALAARSRDPGEPRSARTGADCLVHAFDQRALGSDQSVRDHERLHVARGASGLLGDERGECVRGARDELALTSAQGGTATHDPHRRCDGIRALLVGERLRAIEHEASKRREHRLARGACPHRIDERRFEVLHAAVEQVFLGREVVEDRADGHTGLASDVRHRDRVEALGAEQPRRGIRDRASRQLLLAFAQAGLGAHRSRIVDFLQSHYF